MALRRALQLAIMNSQNNQTFLTSYGVHVSKVIVKDHAILNISFPPYKALQNEKFLSALQLFHQIGKTSAHLSSPFRGNFKQEWLEFLD